MSDEEGRWKEWYGRGVAPDLAARADALYTATVGIVPGPNPGYSGTQLVWQTQSPRNRREAVPAGQWPPCALAADTVHDICWMRGLREDEEGYRWLHVFDRNGAYLAACSSVELGLGGLRHIPGQELAFDRALPGYWLVGSQGHWKATPEVHLMRQRLEVSPVYEAWVWAEHGRALEGFYKRLRGARTRLMYERDREPTGAASLALLGLKRAYTQGIGCMAYHAREHNDPRFVPDWRHQIIATANANTQRIVDGLRGAVAAVWRDELYIPSNEPEAELAAALLGLPLHYGLGACKVKRDREGRPWTVPLEDVRACFGEGGDVGELERRCRACVPKRR